MKSGFSILFFLLFFRNMAFGGAMDTTAIAEHRDKWHDVLGETRDNPAFFFDAFRTSITLLGITADYRNADKPLVAQKGDRHLLTTASVNSYLRLGENNTVWGGAAYQTGKKYHIRFNSTTDYDMLYPYVMADTLGGDLQNECYAFNGGYGVRLKGWTLGVKIDFRAEHEYRVIDPRPRGIATDLTLSLGGSRNLKRYKIGLGVASRTYKQTNNVDFYNPLGVIPVLHMTGLGTNYVRFAGAVRSSYHKGTGIIAGFQLMPVDKNGAYVSARSSYMPYEKILPDLNALPMSRLNVYATDVQIGWKQGGIFRWSAYSGLNHAYRLGNEHIAGSASGAEYKSLITLSMYEDRKCDVYAGGAFGMGNRSRLTIDGRIGWLDDDAKYVDLKREMAFSKCYGKLMCQWLSHNNARWVVDWSGNAAYFHNLSKRMVMPFASMCGQITQLVGDTYDAQTSHLWLLGSQIAICHLPEKWRGAGWLVQLGWQYRKTPRVHQTELNATLGVTF